jgi:phospholipase C
MNCFTPETLPVLSGLAYYYGVCDHWFCSIPSQTICNRSFAQAVARLADMWTIRAPDSFS